MAVQEAAEHRGHFEAAQREAEGLADAWSAANLEAADLARQLERSRLLCEDLSREVEGLKAGVRPWQEVAHALRAEVEETCRRLEQCREEVMLEAIQQAGHSWRRDAAVLTTELEETAQQQAGRQLEHSPEKAVKIEAAQQAERPWREEAAVLTSWMLHAGSWSSGARRYPCWT